MNGIGSLADTKVREVMQGVQLRLAEIENRTGLTFGAYLTRAQVWEEAGVDSVAFAQSLAETQKDTAGQIDLNKYSPAVKTGAFSRLAESEYDGLFAEAADRYGINAALIKAVAFAESNFRPGAVSKSGAMGLMQLMPFTAEALGVDDPFDPAQNVDGGARLISQHLDRFNGDALLALAAYNAGPNGVTSRGITDLTDPEQRNWLPSETKGYLERIERYLDAAQALYVLDAPYAV
ncbi:MAG: lytic transglycosylase domain-containing protein [Oscillospiraceae bacterium]|nr:lytic transglycosylase domain-containing protein [Oscillospiraceae bacterium]